MEKCSTAFIRKRITHHVLFLQFELKTTWSKILFTVELKVRFLILLAY